jgi:predicted RNA binding protein YcfA (HicA-like mRNA interferase family)
METSSRKIMQKLEADGFVLVSVKGPHQRFAGKTVLLSFRTRKKTCHLEQSYRFTNRPDGYDKIIESRELK